MRVSRYILVLLALLTCGVMAAAEVPEMLSLDDDTSNDFVCRPLGAERPVESASRHLAEHPASQCRQSRTRSNKRLIEASSTSPYPDQASPPSLPMLGIQRK